MLCLLVLLPIVQLVLILWSPASGVWGQVRPQLPERLSNSLCLAAGVALGSGLLGTGLAWLTALCEFPGRRFFSWALLLPLAIPAYVLGFVVAGFFDASVPALSLWLAVRGEDAQFPSVYSLGWLTFSLSLSFYPYVYLPARYAFQNHSRRAMEAARSLGAGPFRAFFRAALPASAPWIGAGLALVAMETLADIGTASVFRYDTLSTTVYRAWTGAASLPVAAQWAGFLLLLAWAGLVLERHQRLRQGRCPAPACEGGRARLPALNASPSWAACLCASLALGLAFILPVGQLLAWGALALRDAGRLDGEFAAGAGHVLLIAVAGAGLVVAAALTLGLAGRHYRGAGFFVRIATLGYALPGAVLALGILAPVVFLDDALAGLVKSKFNAEMTWFLGGGVGILLLAYLIRFLALGFGPVNGALQGITPNLVESAHSLGAHGLDLGWRVYWPLLRGGLLGAFLLVFAEIMRELPVVLLMRPAGWDTLAMHVFEVAQAGQWQRAALPGLVLVLAGLPQIYVLARGGGGHHGQ